jgi:hypothetical protein
MRGFSRLGRVCKFIMAYIRDYFLPRKQLHWWGQYWVNMAPPMQSLPRGKDLKYRPLAIRRQALSWLIGSLLQVVPLLLHAQAEMMSTGPMVPDPLPPPPKVVAPPAATVPPPVTPSSMSPGGAVPSTHPSGMAPPGNLPQAKGGTPTPAGPPQVSPDMSQAPMERNPITEILNFWFGYRSDYFRQFWSRCHQCWTRRI